MVKRSFGFKLVVVFTVALFFVATGVGLYALNNIEYETKALIEDRLESDMAIGSELLDAAYPGEWKVRGTLLYKGDFPIAADFPFISKLAKLTGNTVEFYFDNSKLVSSSKESIAIDSETIRSLSQNSDREIVQYEGTQVGVVPVIASDGQQVGFWTINVPDSKYKSMTHDLQIRMMVGAYAALIVTSFLFYFVTRVISKPILQIVDGMTKAEKGDLTVKLEIDTSDEFSFLGEKFNSMINHIGAMVNNISSISEKVASHAETLNYGASESSKITEQIAQTIQMMATGTEDQAKSIEQTSMTINEMSDAIQQVAGNSQVVLHASNEAHAAAEHGGKAVKNAINQMDSISKTVNNSAVTVKALGERSQEIVYIVDIITGIAKQTNLLALNAAIEAARAGEQGRGFAVVAEEVRKLAEQSGEAAKQIADLIKEIQEETNEAVEAMESGLNEVSNGIYAVNNAGDAFGEIINTITKVVNQIHEVSVAAEEMAAGAGQAVAAIQNAASISEETAASAQQIAASAEQQTASVEETAASASLLATLAEDLKDSVRHFKIR